MPDWRTARLESIAEVRPSNVDKKSNLGEQPVRLCNYMDVYLREYITEDIEFMEATATPVEIQRFGIERGDVMITKDSETPDDIGIPAVVVDDIPKLVCGYHVALIKPNRAVVDPVYLAKQLGLPDTARYYGRLANGSTRYGLSYQSIARTPIRLAPLGQQQRIAEILSSVDEAIEQTETLIAKTQQIKAGLMHDLFTRGVTADGMLRPSREEAPQLYKESPLGWIPKEWYTVLLDEIATRGSGHTPNKNHPEYWNGTIKWVSLADSWRLDRVHISDTDHKITQAGIDNSSAVLHPPGIVVLSRDAGVGKSAITTAEMAVSQHFMCWRCGPRLYNYFLYYWLQYRKWEFENIATGSTIPTIGLRFFRHYRINVPMQVAEQTRIATALLATEEQVFRLDEDLRKLRCLRAGLMQDLLIGRVSLATHIWSKAKEVAANV